MRCSKNTYHYCASMTRLKKGSRLLVCLTALKIKRGEKRRKHSFSSEPCGYARYISVISLNSCFEKSSFLIQASSLSNEIADSDLSEK